MSYQKALCVWNIITKCTHFLLHCCFLYKQMKPNQTAQKQQLFQVSSQELNWGTLISGLSTDFFLFNSSHFKTITIFRPTWCVLCRIIYAMYWNIYCRGDEMLHRTIRETPINCTLWTLCRSNSLTDSVYKVIETLVFFSGLPCAARSTN